MDLKKRLLHFAQCGDVDQFRLAVQEAERQSTKVMWNMCCHPKSGDTLVHVASRFGHMAILRCLREEIANVNFEVANFDGKRAIHEAAQMGQLKCLRYLLSLGVEVNCLKRADWTPLMLSCTKDSLEVVQTLVDGGAYLGLKNKDGWTCFHIACRQGNLAIISYLLAVQPSAWDTVSRNGRTPLHTAALHGLIDVVRVLLKRGRYPADQKDCCGTTPLMDAARIGRVDIVDLLISEHEADVFAKDNIGRQAIHLAAEGNCYRAVIHLIERWDVDCNVEANAGVTPLHLACKEGHHEVVKALMNCGADAHLRDEKGRTAYDIASACQRHLCSKFLVHQVTNIKEAAVVQ